MKNVIALIVIIFAFKVAKAQVYADTLKINDSTIVVVSYNSETFIFNCSLRYSYIGKYQKVFLKTPLIVDTSDRPDLEPTGKYKRLKITSKPKYARDYVAFKIGKNKYIYSYGNTKFPPSLKREIKKDTEGQHNDDHSELHKPPQKQFFILKNKALFA